MAETPSSTLISKSAYARLKGLSPSLITEQVQKGIIPTHGPKRMIDPEEADRRRTELLARKHPARAEKAHRGSRTPRAELDRQLTAEKLAQAQIQTRKLRGELLERSAVEKRGMDRARHVRDAVLNWPGRHAATMAAELGVPADKLHRVLEVALRDLLTDLATHPPAVEEEAERAAG